MKRFIRKIFFYFFLPIVIIAALSEYSIRQIPNDYSYKNQWMEENGKELEVLCLGPSSIYYGINPQYLDKKSFNGSHVSQPLKYDNFLFNKYIDKMDSLEYLILGIDYWSPFSSLESSDEWWRIINYSIYYDCDYHEGELKYNFELAMHNLSTFQKAFKGLSNVIGLSDYSNIQVNKFGFGLNYSIKNKKSDWDNGAVNGLRHTDWIRSQEHFNFIYENHEYLNDICKKCEDRAIKVILIGSPTYESYRANLDSDYLQTKNDFCNWFDESFENVSYFDFSDDSRFQDEDFYDAYHLNDIGAHKLTEIINTEIFELNLSERTEKYKLSN